MDDEKLRNCVLKIISEEAKGFGLRSSQISDLAKRKLGVDISSTKVGVIGSKCEKIKKVNENSEGVRWNRVDE